LEKRSQLNRRSRLLLASLIASVGLVASPSSLATSATVATAPRTAARADPPLRISSCTGSASQARRWVQLLYLRSLDRCAEGSASDVGITKFGDPATRAGYSRSAFRSLEAGRDWTGQAYEEVLNRPVDAAGRTYWANRLHAGTRFDVVEAGLAASPEFFRVAGGTNDDWVLAAYETLLARDPNAAESTYWTNQLNSGRSRLQTAVAFVQSHERRVQIVDLFGFGFVLHRSAGSADLEYWAGRLQSIDQLDLMARFVASPEAVTDVDDPNF
jgi:hypothetical protein